jgi:hypothetical protein
MNADNSSDARSYAFTVGSTYLISSRTVNALRLAFTRNHLLTVSPEYFSLEELGSKVYSGYVPKRSKLTVTSGFTLPGNGQRNFGIDFYQVSDDVNMTRGTHQFSFGGRIANSRTNVALQTNMSPNFNFSGAVAGLGLADFLLGKASDFNQGTSSTSLRVNMSRSIRGHVAGEVKLTLTRPRWALSPQVDVHPFRMF